MESILRTGLLGKTGNEGWAKHDGGEVRMNAELESLISSGVLEVNSCLGGFLGTEDFPGEFPGVARTLNGAFSLRFVLYAYKNKDIILEGRVGTSVGGDFLGGWRFPWALSPAEPIRIVSWMSDGGCAAKAAGALFRETAAWLMSGIDVFRLVGSRTWDRLNAERLPRARTAKEFQMKLQLQGGGR